MKYPFFSFACSLLFWLVVFVGFSGWFFVSKNHQEDFVNNVVNIDANLIEDAKPSIKKQEVKQKIIPPPKPKDPQIIQDKPAAKPVVNQQNQASSNQNQTATPIERPLPKIPDDLRSEAFSSYAIARFNINADGSFKVELIKPCNSPQLNFLLLQSLKKWKFVPEKHFGIAVSTIKDIKVEFKVE